MNLQRLYKMQQQLDDSIMQGKEMSDNEVLVSRILALQTEISEFANATRCFKYWSTKEADKREDILEEYVDIMHFFLSLGNTLGFTPVEIEQAYIKKNEENYRRQENGY